MEGILQMLGDNGAYAIGAAIAIAGGAIATALVQSNVGSSGMGLIAEKPEEFGKVIMLFAIPETLVLFGFVVAFMLMGHIH
jgi:V/A-type H+-transporting ATPase subunit K